MNEMIIKKTKLFFKKVVTQQPKKTGYTILETLVATGIAAIVITSTIGVTGSVYQSQKKIQFAQNFFSESRFLMERVAQVARNNTLDYDRYFVELGPYDDGDAGGNGNVDFCDEFMESQLPKKYKDDEFSDGDYDNEKEHRSILSYENVFYWDTNNDDEPDRNLGGMDPDGDLDACTKAWETPAIIQNLFLINGSRTERTAIRRHPSSIRQWDLNQDGTPETDNDNVYDPVNYYDLDNVNFDKLEMQRQLGVDVDGDGNIDLWGPSTESVTVDIDGGGDQTGKPLIYWDDANTDCLLYLDLDDDGYDVGEPSKLVVGESNSADFCHRAYDFTVVSPDAMTISELNFSLSPNRDPFLNFRVEDAQIHPQVFISLTTEVREPKRYGFDDTEDAPKISFQTMVSSRVFGNTRQ